MKYSCDYCSFHANNFDEFANHLLDIEHIAECPENVCCYCMKTCDSRDKVMRHVKKSCSRYKKVQELLMNLNFAKFENERLKERNKSLKKWLEMADNATRYVCDVSTAAFNLVNNADS